MQFLRPLATLALACLLALGGGAATMAQDYGYTEGYVYTYLLDDSDNRIELCTQVSSSCLIYEGTTRGRDCFGDSVPFSRIVTAIRRDDNKRARYETFETTPDFCGDASRNLVQLCLDTDRDPEPEACVMAIRRRSP